MVQRLKGFALHRGEGNSPPLGTVAGPAKLGLVDFELKLLLGSNKAEGPRFAGGTHHGPLGPGGIGRIQLRIGPFGMLFQ